ELVPEIIAAGRHRQHEFFTLTERLSENPGNPGCACFQLGISPDAWMALFGRDWAYYRVFEGSDPLVKIFDIEWAE
ncbi:MAG: hypothetical protein ACREP9_10395, partial [Candidatus Dormibacteraceae bacterium]